MDCINSGGVAERELWFLNTICCGKPSDAANTKGVTCMSFAANTKPIDFLNEGLEDLAGGGDVDSGNQIGIFKNKKKRNPIRCVVYT